MEQKKVEVETGQRVESRVEIHSSTAAAEQQWSEQLSEGFAAIGFVPESIERSRAGASGAAAISIVDAQIPDLLGVLRSIPREGRSIFLLVDEARTDSDLDQDVFECIDDVIVYPFRAFELEGKIRLHHLLRGWSDVMKMNVTFQQLLENLSDDVALAERLQKANLPVRFPSVKGFRVRSRYLAGMRSGGDHFDLADSKDGSRISLVLSDSSSYGLSSAFLNSLMRVALKLSRDEVRSATETVRLIQEDLSKILTEKDHLSLFYGVLNRKDLRFRFLHVGSSVLFHAPEGRSFQVYQGTHGPITQAEGVDRQLVEREIELNANDRLVLLSDGYIDRAGGVEESLKVLNALRARESEDSLNEFTFQVKRRFQDEDDMPEQDCTAVVMDVDSRSLKLV